MKNLIWTAIAILAGALALGGAVTLAGDSDAPTKGGDLVLTLLLATAAVMAWRKRDRGPRRPRPARVKGARPWER